jgi:hypothetical protein
MKHRAFLVIAVLLVNNPSTAEEDRSAGRPVPTRKLWGKEYADAVAARNRADGMRAALEGRISAARREWRKAGKRGPLPTSDAFEAQAAEVARAYQDVIDRYPHTEIAAYCALRLSGHYKFQQQHDKARELTEQTAIDFAGTSQGNKAVFSAGLFHLQTRHDPAEAIKWFCRIPKPAKPAGGPYDEDDKLYLSAQEHLVKCELALRQDAQAKQRIDDLKQAYPQYAGELSRSYQFEVDSRDSRPSPLERRNITVYAVVIAVFPLVILIGVFVFRQPRKRRTS